MNQKKIETQEISREDLAPDGNDRNREFVREGLKWAAVSVLFLAILQNPVPQPVAGIISIINAGLILRFNPLKY